MTREAFREAVLARDKYLCVVCKNNAQDAHHIMERRLWDDGGYFPMNGVSLCFECHILAEQTTISTERLRELAGITWTHLPPHLYKDQTYDKWGNIILEDGRRLKGELFFDEGVQKILASGGVLGLFDPRVKYPRTYHLPGSPGITDDDRIFYDAKTLFESHLICTEKMDGENTTMYRDFIHARSLDGLSHPSQDWVKNFWSTIRHDIPDGWRICGENLYAKHSIGYKELPSYFMGFSVWNEKNICLSWKETLEWFDLLGITPVPLVFDQQNLTASINSVIDNVIKRLGTDQIEGFVIRKACSFSYKDFRNSVVKWVRANHVTSDNHWLWGKQMIKNEMKGTVV